MHPLIPLKRATSVFLIVLGFVWLGLVPTAQAVNPAPDGGYPGGNTAEGQNALFGLTSGGYNTAVGFFSLRSNTTNGFNTAIGAGALFANMEDGNTATGAGALLSNTLGSQNTANGAFALFSSTTGGGNTATGYQALFNNTANTNTATGFQALLSNVNGGANTADGKGALLGNVSGNGNTADGFNALFDNTGSNNTAIGAAAGSNLTTGDNNIDIGAGVTGVAGESNTIRIGNTDITTAIIRGISGTTIPSGSTVLVTSNGQLGTMTSSGRFKRDIKPMDQASEALFSLKPVSFHYQKQIDPSGVSQFGLVAEDVEKVNPDLVVCDEEGKPYAVRYDQVNAMLLNEFLKEHKAFLKEQRKVEELEKQIEALTAGLQKVSAQLELNKAAPHTVLNNQLNPLLLPREVLGNHR